MTDYQKLKKRNSAIANAVMMTGGGLALIGAGVAVAGLATLAFNAVAGAAAGLTAVKITSAVAGGALGASAGAIGAFKTNIFSFDFRNLAAVPMLFLMTGAGGLLGAIGGVKASEWALPKDIPAEAVTSPTPPSP